MDSSELTVLDRSFVSSHGKDKANGTKNVRWMICGPSNLTLFRVRFGIYLRCLLKFPRWDFLDQYSQEVLQGFQFGDDNLHRVRHWLLGAFELPPGEFEFRPRGIRTPPPSVVQLATGCFSCYKPLHTAAHHTFALWILGFTWPSIYHVQIVQWS